MDRKGKRTVAQMRAKASVRKIKPKTSSAAKGLHAKSSRDKVRAYRKRMRAKGLRLVQIWVPDTKTELAAESITTVKRAWAQARAVPPRQRLLTFEDIADLAGSVDGLPRDLSSNTKKYLRATGYGSKRSR